jgi:ATP-dependent Lhr-like helicase
MVKISEKTKANTKKQLDKILHPFVKEWFYGKFKEYSKPQLFAVMEIHSRKNVLVSATTGATKTLTGFLSILNELVDSADKGILEERIYAVYISPLKALNEDIRVNLVEPLKEIQALAKEKYNRELDIRVAVRGGDTSQSEKSKMLKKPPHILITTPESLGIVLSSTKFVEHLKAVEWCIIDEIHALAESKRGTHLSVSIENLERLSGHITRIGLSATVSPLNEVAHFLVGNERECTIINVPFIKELDLQVMSAVDNLVDITYHDLHVKTYTLIDTLVQQHKTTLIFTNTRAATERIVHHLKEMFPKNYTESAEDLENDKSSFMLLNKCINECICFHM